MTRLPVVGAATLKSRVNFLRFLAMTQILLSEFLWVYARVSILRTTPKPEHLLDLTDLI